MATKISKIALYTRVSTKEQAERNLSIPAQLRALQEHCRAKGYEVVREYSDEGFTGTSENRPGLQQMKSDIESGAIDIDAVLVIESSRFFRNTFLRSHWKDQLANSGVHVLSMNQSVETLDTADGELYEDLLAVFAQNESRRIGERTSRGMQENARQGYFNGSRPPYGYAVEKVADGSGAGKGRLVVNKQEAEVVKRVFELYTNEGLGALAIAKRLHESGQFTRKGGHWDKFHILRMLENTAYIGKHVYNKVRVKRNKNLGNGPQYAFLERPETEWIITPVEPIIDLEIFECAQQSRVTKACQRNKWKAHNSPMLLTGFLRCGKCGSSLVSEKAKGGKYVYYFCSRAKNEGVASCPGCRLPASAVEEALIEHLITEVFGEENIRAVVAKVMEASLAQKRSIGEIRHELDDVQSRLKRYYDSFETGTWSVGDVAERVKELQVRQKALAIEYAERTEPKTIPDDALTPEAIAVLQARFRDVFVNGPITVIKRYLSILLEDILVEADTLHVRGKTAGLMAALEQKENVRTDDVTAVRTTSNIWRPQGDSNPCRRRERAVS